jgi:hypothetical protein
MYFIQSLNDGGYILSGKCSSLTDNTTNFCFLKMDCTGNMIWAKQFSDNTFMPGMPMNEWATTIRENSDGSFIFGGAVDDPNYNSSGAYYGWMDSMGVLQNSIIKTTTWSTRVNALLLNQNGNIVSLRDNNMGSGHHENELEILTSNGNVLSGSSSGSFSLFKQGLVNMVDGGYGAIGIEETYQVDPAYYNLPVVSRYDQSGNKLWSYRIHHEVFSGDTHYTAICATPDTGVLICGNIEGAIKKIILTRFSSTGDSLWSKSIGGTNSFTAKSIQPTNDGGYAVAGTSGDDVLLMKLDSDGDMVWSKTFGGSGDDEATYLQQTNDGGFIILAHTNGSGPASIMLIRTDANGSTTTTTTTTGKVDPAETLSLYPDPFSSTLNINFPGNLSSKLMIYDMAGRIVFSDEIFSEHTGLDLSFLPAGSYNAIFSSKELLISKRIVKQ